VPIQDASSGIDAGLVFAAIGTALVAHTRRRKTL